MSGLVERAVSHALGASVGVVSARAASGGCISSATLLTLTDGRDVFLKLHDPEPAGLLERESEGLAALERAAAIRTPEVVGVGKVGGKQYLLLEAISESTRPPGFFADLGRRFARLHRGTVGERCGFERDNFIGATPQPNGWLDSWPEFFARRRLGFQLRLARQRGRSTPELDRLGDRLLAVLESRLEVPGEVPCLLHGDLWSGNLLCDDAGRPVLIDPACYHGHREADLAMTRLFGGFGADFYGAYEEEWPLPPGSAERLDIYKLYHLLNHLNLFGGSYLRDCIGLLKKIV